MTFIDAWGWPCADWDNTCDLAVSAWGYTESEQRDVLQDTASRIATQARTLELASGDGDAAGIAAAHIAAAQVSGRQRGRQVDENGYKLSHVPDNDYDKFFPELKELYRHLDRVMLAFKAG